MRPVVIDLMTLVERHGADRAEVIRVVRNFDAPPDEARIVDTWVRLFGCKRFSGELGNTAHRSIPIAQGAAVDESRYIAHQVAKRLEA